MHQLERQTLLQFPLRLVPENGPLERSLVYTGMVTSQQGTIIWDVVSSLEPLLNILVFYQLISSWKIRLKIHLWLRQWAL